MPNYTDNLRLEKPLQSENYNIDVFNGNADKIDTAIQEVKGSLNELQVEVNGQRLRGINIANSIIDKLEG